MGLDEEDKLHFNYESSKLESKEHVSDGDGV